VIELTPRQQLEQALVLNPADLESYFALAELHIQEKRLGEAVHVLNKALAASGNDIQVQERLEDAEMLRQRQQLEVAEQRAGKQPESPASQQLVEQLRNDLNRYELDVFERRARRYPEDPELQFQLALRLKRAGNVRQAIPCFEQAVRSPLRQAGATLELGECRQRLKEYAQALDDYLQAAEWAAQPEQMPLRLLAWYRAALLHSGLGNPVAAEELWDRIVQADPTYRDASARLDKTRQMRHKS
jgi:tetratricopeptide (TPR) repeat protein